MLATDLGTVETTSDTPPRMPPPPLPFMRLREACIRGDECSESDRARIRELAPALAHYSEGVAAAVKALAGPDPEMALTYFFDAFASLWGPMRSLETDLFP